MPIENDLRAAYNESILREIAHAAKLHAELIQKYGEDKRKAKLFGDVYLALSNFIDYDKWN